MTWSRCDGLGVMKSVFSPVQAFGSGWLDASSVLDSWFRSYRSLGAFVHRRRRVESRGVVVEDDVGYSRLCS